MMSPIDSGGLQDIFLNWLGNLHDNARLVILLDPTKILESSKDVIDSKGRQWRSE